MEELRQKLRDNGQEHILEAFPNLKATDSLAKQLIKLNLRGLLDSYREANAVDGRHSGVSTFQCGSCCEEVLPVDSVRLYDHPSKK